MRILILLVCLSLPAIAAVARVQTKGGHNDSGGAVAVSFDATPTVGNVIVVAVAVTDFTPGTVPCTDNQSNTYTARKAQGSGGPYLVSLTAPAATASGTFTVTCTPSGFTSTTTVMIAEYSGADASSPVDQTAGAGVTGTGGSGPPDNASSGASSTRTSANQMLVGHLYTDDTGATPAAGTGYSGYVEETGARSVALAHKSVSSTGTDAALFSISSFQNFIVNLITLKEPSASTSRKRVVVAQ